MQGWYARMETVCKSGDCMQGWRQYERVKTMLGKQEGQRLLLRQQPAHQVRKMRTLNPASEHRDYDRHCLLVTLKIKIPIDFD